MKIRKAVLATGMMAGLATVPLSASADTAAANLPYGSASASAVNVQLSLASVHNVVDQALGWQKVTDALTQLQQALCPNSTDSTTTCPLGLTFPTDLPTSLQVSVAQASDEGWLNAAANDVVSGDSSSSPVQTDWKVLDANIGAIETQIANVINQGAGALAQGGVNGLTAYLDGTGLHVDSQALGTADLNVLGTVTAALGKKGVTDNPWGHADAVSVNLNGDAVQQNAPQIAGTAVTVDPFNAYALNSATTQGGKTGPEVSAANTSAAISLPALLVNNTGGANLAQLTTELHSLVDAVTNAIANPSQAGSILSSVPGVPAPLQSTLTQIGGLVSQTVGGVAASAPVQSPVDVSALKVWDTQLSSALDALNAFNSAVAGLDLPNVSSLVSIKDSIATSKTIPVAGGGVASSATARVGELSVLPIGGTLAGAINQAIGSLPTTAGITVNQVAADTPLLSIDGITSTADAAVGPNTGSPTGTAGLNTVSVLGQTINLDGSLPNMNGALPSPVPAIQPLGPGQEWRHVFTIPAVGSVTLDITRGVAQTVIDSTNERQVAMAALEVRLLNGAIGCSSSDSNCTDPIPAAPSTGTKAATTRTATSTQTGIPAFGGDGTTVVGAGLADTAAHVLMNGGSGCTGSDCGGCTTNCGSNPGCHGTGSPTCPLNEVASITSLPKTGMFGGAALPAGLLLVGVAISLRVVPGLRTRVRRVR